MYDWNYFENLPGVHPIADANNLVHGFRAARKGSHWKGQVQRFRWNMLSEVRKLQKELMAFLYGDRGAYELSPYSKFFVNERGKIRAITALSIRDRVVKHVLNDLYLIPHIRPHLIYDNGASLKGKGVSFTRNRLLAHLQQFWRETGSNDGYILCMDFSGYYDNIDHRKAMEMIRKYEPDYFARKLVLQALDSYRVDVSWMDKEQFTLANQLRFSMVAYRKENHPEGGTKFLNRSLSVGDQTSQITAIAFPTPIDTLVKTVLGCRFYARYMDDLYVIARTKDELRMVRDRIIEAARKLKIFINHKKTQICKLDRTFTFMKYKYYLKEDGAVVVRMNKESVTRMRRKLRRLAGRVRKGLTRQIKVTEMFRSWIGNYAGILSNLQCSHIVELYRSLFGGELDKWMKLRAIM